MTCDFSKKPHKNSTQLNAGAVSTNHFDLLIKLANIHSESVIMALRAFFVNGEARKDVCSRCGVNQGYLSVKIKHMQEISRIVFESYPYYI